MPASSAIKSDAISRWDLVEGQTLPELVNLIIPIDKSWFFSQDFHFDKGLI
jgi:hypothetical protein